MPDIPNAEVYGIGAIAIALIGLIWKIWSDSNKRSDKLVEVMTQTAISQQTLSRNVEENTRVTREQADLLKRQNAAILELILKMKRNGHA